MSRFVYRVLALQRIFEREIARSVVSRERLSKVTRMTHRMPLAQ